MVNFATKKAEREKEINNEVDLIFTAATPEEIKAIGDDLPEGYIAGWASTPDLDRGNDIVKTGAFDESIRTRGLKGPKSVKLLLNHERDKGAGEIVKLETRAGRLWMEAQLNLDITYVKDAYLAAKSAGGYSFSVGFRREEWAWRVDEEHDDEYLEISKADLWEVSVVPFPMNEECIMTFIKSDDTIESLGDFERFLVAKGWVKSRNMARQITQAVKETHHLFQPKPPRLADNDVKGIQLKLEALKSKMAQVAKS